MGRFPLLPNERVQLKNDILYEHHKAEQDICTELLTLTLKRWQERLQGARKSWNSSSLPERRGRPDYGCIAGIQELRGESVVYGLGRQCGEYEGHIEFQYRAKHQRSQFAAIYIRDFHGEFYGCGIASEGNVLKFVSKGCNQTIKFK